MTNWEVGNADAAAGSSIRQSGHYDMARPQPPPPPPPPPTGRAMMGRAAPIPTALFSSTAASSGANHPNTSNITGYGLTMETSPAGPTGALMAATTTTTTSSQSRTFLRESSSSSSTTTTAMALAVPTRPSPPPPPPPPPPSQSANGHPPSRFQFVSDRRAPVELNRLETETIRKRAEFRSRVLDVQRRAASWTARLAQESVERETEAAQAAERSFHSPLERAVERVMGRIDENLVRSNLTGTPQHHPQQHQVSPLPAPVDDDDDYEGDEEDEDEDEPKRKITFLPTTKTNKAPSSSIAAIERAVSNLDLAMSRHVHVTCHGLRSRRLDALRTSILLHGGSRRSPTSTRTAIMSNRQDAFDHNLSNHNFMDTSGSLRAALKLESAKTDRREGSMVRAFESIAAAATRGLAETEARRVANVGLLMKDVRAGQPSKHDSGLTTEAEFLRRVSVIAEMVQAERRQRQRQDELIVNKIVQTREMLQRSVLESLGDAG